MHWHDNNLHVIKRSCVSSVRGAQFQLACIVYLTVDQHNWCKLHQVIAKVSICFHPVGHEIITLCHAHQAMSVHLSSETINHLSIWVLAITSLHVTRKTHLANCIHT